MVSSDIHELLKHPIAWENWQSDTTTRRLLRGLQANILKGHGREHTRNIFLSFVSADTPALCTVIRRLGRSMPSALDQLQASERFKLTGESGGPVLCFFLRPSGYAALGVPGSAPEASDFLEGMQVRGPDSEASPPISDPAVEDWDLPFQNTIDAMLLVAGTDDIEADVTAGLWIDRLTDAGATVLTIEHGLAIKRKVAEKFEGVEHFGYVDGRSQPLFLAEDVEREARSHWDPAFPPSQFLVKDPGDDGATSFGSYFVFRKLEQNVQGFHDQEDALSAALGLAGGPFESRAGALLVGRFEDGTPVVLNPLPTDMPPVNDFDYRSDEPGSRCPFISHVRKTNPRGESPFHLAKDLGFASTVRQERSHIMARRGITYGARHYDDATNDFTDEPTGGVGLLFMAYMADIANQFEFTQATWANNADFVTANTGADPVIAQGPAEAAQIDDGWGGMGASFNLNRFVTMKGGEYFFAPSREFLKAI